MLFLYVHQIAVDQKLNGILNSPNWSKTINILIGILIVWVAVKVLQKTLFTRIKENENRYRAHKLGNYVGFFLTVLIIAFGFSVKFGNLSVAFGVAGAGIAFALQEVIASFAGWLAIIFGGFYKTGDRVQLGGIKGDVMDIGVLRTTVMETGQWVEGDLYNGRIVLIANSFIFKEPVFNYSGDFPFLWDEIKIPIQYGSNYQKARAIIENAGFSIAGDLIDKSKKKWTSLQNKYRLEEAQTEPMVSMICNDNWVEFTLRYVVNYKKRRSVKTELFAKILQEVEATKGEVNFGSATFQMVGGSKIDVRNI